MASVNQDEQVATQAVVKPRGPNSETVQGDIEYDGRVVLYIIKGRYLPTIPQPKNMHR